MLYAHNFSWLFPQVMGHSGKTLSFGIITSYLLYKMQIKKHYPSGCSGWISGALLTPPVCHTYTNLPADSIGYTFTYVQNPSLLASFTATLVQANIYLSYCRSFLTPFFHPYCSAVCSQLYKGRSDSFQTLGRWLWSTSESLWPYLRTLHSLVSSPLLLLRPFPLLMLFQPHCLLVVQTPASKPLQWLFWPGIPFPRLLQVFVRLSSDKIVTPPCSIPPFSFTFLRSTYHHLLSYNIFHLILLYVLLSAYNHAWHSGGTQKTFVVNENSHTFGHWLLHAITYQNNTYLLNKCYLHYFPFISQGITHRIAHSTLKSNVTSF